MKHLITLSLAMGVSASGAVLAQQGEMMNDMHKDMPMDMHKDSRQGMNETKSEQGPMVHHATGTVKSVDQAKGVVTLMHGPVKTLNWPGMTMGFVVKDKAMLEQFLVGSKVDVEFVKEGAKYVITAMK